MNEFSAYKDSPEKQKVRLECWVPLLASRKQEKSSRLKYLTLPGKELTELKLLIDEDVIEGMHDLILCESQILEYYQICRDLPNLPFKAQAEIPVVAFGRIEDLLSTGSLDPYLPLDAANLDFVGGAWGNNRTESSAKLNAIRHLIEVQSQHGVPFTLFLTVSSRGGGESALGEVLEEYRSGIDEETWSTITQLPYHAKILTALPLILIHWGIDNGFDVRCTHRYTYVGTGLSTRMLKFAFEFTPYAKPKFTSATSHKLRIERQRAREVLDQATIELVLEESTGQVTDRVYDPVSN